MKKTIFNLFLLSITLLLQNCGVEETNWDFQSGTNGKLVVESILTTEQKKQAVRLSLSRNDLNGTSIPITDAVVSINNGQDDFTFLASTEEPGLYESLQQSVALPGRLYTLTINWNEETYIAQNQMVFVSPIPQLRFNRVNESDSMKLANPPSVFSATQQAIYEYNIDWSALTGDESSRAQQIFYVFESIDANGIFKSDPMPVYFPEGSRVIVKKYGLNEDFAAYLRALAMEVEWQGGLLDENSSSLPTNVSNGGLGYFGVCAVRVDTVWAE
ncbi:MAG: hypothetical protein ACI8YQ_000467 [Polaribacter sp.]|jgi:hypothetical protein